jgi:mannose-1-phosphate guanylyltransferase
VIYSVIMVGGSGTRLWPASRAGSPKQMMKIADERTLLDTTVRRARAVSGERIILVATAQLAGLIREAMPDLPADALVIEPEGRDTAACVGLAAVHVASRDPDGVMVVMPADHVVGPLDRFAAIAAIAAELADRDRCLVTIGIVPRGPATGYGYIHRGEKLTGKFATDAYRVRRFREKPDRATAELYVASGEYYWNSGIFAWRADVILGEIASHLPEHDARLKRFAAAIGTGAEARVLGEVYGTIPRISIDYGILEKASSVAVVEADFDWDDVGSWSALAAHLPVDASGNAVRGQFLGIEARDCVVDVPEGKLVVGVGIQGLVVVDTGDVLLLIPRSRDQDVKKVVDRLKALGKTEYL